MTVPAKVLEAQLNLLINYIDLKIATLDDDRCSYEARMAKTQGYLNGLNAELAAVQKQINYLDSTELERIELKQQHHKCTPLSPTPSFTFSIDTVVAIRNVAYDLPPGSSWKEPPFEGVGETHFEGKLKNNKWSSAKASIELFGHRRDKYAAKLVSLRATHVLLTEAIRGESAVLKQEQEKFALFECGASLYRLHRSLAEEDLVRVRDQLDQGMSNNSTNMYIFCTKLGLKSQVWKSHILSEGIESKINSQSSQQLFRGLQSAQMDVEQHLKKLELQLRQQVNGVQTDQDLKMSLSRLKLKGMVKSASVDLEYMTARCETSRRHDLSTTPPTITESIATQTEALMLFQNNRNSVSVGLKNALTALANPSNLPPTSTNQEATAELEEALLKTKLDLLATSYVLGILEAEVWPISVYACFQDEGLDQTREGQVKNEEEGIACWMEVWEGVRRSGVRVG